MSGRDGLNSSTEEAMDCAALEESSALDDGGVVELLAITIKNSRIYTKIGIKKEQKQKQKKMKKISQKRKRKKNKKRKKERWKNKPDRGEEMSS